MSRRPSYLDNVPSLVVIIPGDDDGVSPRPKRSFNPVNRIVVMGMHPQIALVHSAIRKSGSTQRLVIPGYGKRMGP
jgi:hypothetical protein